MAKKQNESCTFTEEQLKGIKNKLEQYDMEHSTPTINFEDLTKPLHNFRYSDPVDHPAHYNQGGIECIDAMLSAFGTEGVITFCRINAFKYIWRASSKGGLLDIKKAIYYLNYILKLNEEDSC